MKKIKMLLLSSAVLVVSACSLGKVEDPQVVIQDMIGNMQNMTASTFNVDADINYDYPEMESSVKAKVNVTGKSEMGEGTAPSANVEVGLSADTKDGEEVLNGTAKLMVTVTDGSLYAKLDELTLPEEMQKQVASYVDLYKGNWYKFPTELMPEELKAQLNGTVDAMDKEKQVQIEKAIKEGNIFDVVDSKTEGDDYVYTVGINIANLKAVAMKIGEIQGQTATEEDLAMLDELNNYDTEIVLYINKSSHYLDKLMLKVDATKDGETVALDLNLAISNHDQAQNITAPEGAEDFNLMGLMGLGMMLEGSQGSNMGDDSGDMIDYSEINSMDYNEMMDESGSLMMEDLPPME